MYSRVFNQTQHHLKTISYSYNGLWNLPIWPLKFCKKKKCLLKLHVVKPLFFWSLSSKNNQTFPPILFTSSVLCCLLSLKLNCRLWISGMPRRQNFKKVRVLPSPLLVLLLPCHFSFWEFTRFHFCVNRLWENFFTLKDYLKEGPGGGPWYSLKFSSQFAFFP